MNANDSELLASLKAIASGAAQLRAFEAALKQQTQAITDLLARIMEKEKEPSEPEKEDGPDIAALVQGLSDAMRNMPPPQISVTPAQPTTAGAAWDVEGKGPGGHPFKMKITKL